MRETPLLAVARGMVAGTIGTAVMDTVWFVRYRRGGGKDSLADWEFSASLHDWDDAPAPAQVGRRLVEGLFQTKLPPSAARLSNNVMHWSYGVLWGGTYGLLAGSIARGFPQSTIVAGLAFGSGVWVSDYVALPVMKLYRPIWQYDGKTLARDFTAHLAYGLGTASTFRLLARRRNRT